MKKMHVYIGTSGWVYPHWRGRFYPADLHESDWLGHYASHLGSVEVNRSFYRLPTRGNFAAWRQQTPAGFVFSVKASRYITHMKKLREPEHTLPPLLTAVCGLEEKLGALLFQLPPRWRPDLARLNAFLAVLPGGQRAAFELRDPSRQRDAVMALPAGHNAAFCIYVAGVESPRAVTADFVYLRLHGPGAAYSGGYGRRALAGWADWLGQQTVAAADVYFDNDQATHVVRDARALRAMLS